MAAAGELPRHVLGSAPRGARLPDQFVGDVELGIVGGVFVAEVGGGSAFGRAVVEGAPFAG